MRVFENARRQLRILTLYISPTILAACGSMLDRAPPVIADTVLTHARIHTVNPDQPRAEAIAIRDGRILFVGSAKEAGAFGGTTTRTVDLEGRFVMPGLVDAHVHPVRGALKELYQCSFPFSATPAEIRETIGGCVEAQPDASWILGGQWDSGFFERFSIASPREFLDAVSGDKAVYLSDDSLHNAWVNSRALELAGVDAATPDPPGGAFERDANGVPNGIVIEAAADALEAVRPAYNAAQSEAAAVEFSRIANAYGITGAKAASTYETEMAALKAADDAGKLSLHVAVSIRTVDGQRAETLDYDALEATRDRYASRHVHTEFAKIFLDGVPTPARTAAMLAPYRPDDAHGSDFRGGPLLVAPDALTADVAELDRRGFTVKLHAAGDRSVRAALDAIEAARRSNGDRERRHEIAHAGYIDPADIARFAQLNVVADLSPIIWYPSLIIDSIVSALGEKRANKYWPVRDLLDAGAPLLAGSDWPAAVPDANPWVGIEALVTRRDPRTNARESLWPEQAITLAEAIDIYTIQGARALRLEALTGTIEAGKSADLIVLDRDLFEIPIVDVSETKVLATYFEGRRVYP